MEQIINKYAIMTLSGLFAVFLFNYIDWKHLDASAWAAWVQAIGSIGALGVAIYVSKAQARNDRARETRRLADENDNILMNAQAIFENARQVIIKMPDMHTPAPTIKEYIKTGLSKIEINCAAQALAAIDLQSLKWWEAIRSVLEMREIFSKAHQAMLVIERDVGTFPHKDSWRQALDQIGRCKKSAGSAIRAIEALRGTVMSQSATAAVY